MGIQGLTKLLAENAPDCCREQKFESYFGRKIAVDASMHIYQFMVAVGRVGDQVLTNEAGEVTSHLQGMLYRTARMLEAGLKPVYVFDGKPPQLKSDNLVQRGVRREGAEAGLKAAEESGDQEAIEKYSKRTVKVTRAHNEECKRLLRLMGVPVVEAPSEAEAQCAAMAKAEVVYGVATEDMDALTFGTPRLIRNLMAPSSATAPPIKEFTHAKILSGLDLTEEQFVDLCILCGCDYATNIRGIGPVRALQLIRTHGTIDAVIKSLDTTKFPVPASYPYAEAKQFFLEPEVTAAKDLPVFKWETPDVAGLVAFLVGEKGFAEDRVRRCAEKILASKGKANQGRLESFFGPVITKPGSSKPATPAAPKPGDKRKGGPAPGGAGAKKGKSGVGGGKKK